MRPCFEKLPPKQQILVKDCRRDAPGWQEEGDEGKHCQLPNHPLLPRMCWCSWGRQAGWGWALWVSCFLQVSCFLFLLSQPLGYFWNTSPLSLNYLLLQAVWHWGRNCGTGQELWHWGRNCVALFCLSFFRAVNAEPFVQSIGVLTHHVLLAFPFFVLAESSGSSQKGRRREVDG